MSSRFLQLVWLCSNRSAFDYDKKTLVVPLFFYIKVQTSHSLMCENLWCLNYLLFGWPFQLILGIQVRSVLAQGGILFLFSSDVFVVGLRRWEVVCQLAVGVLVVAGAMEREFLHLVWGLGFVGERELRKHLQTMSIHCNICPQSPTEFSQMGRAKLPAYLLSRAGRA